MEHLHDLANKGYFFRGRKKFTIEELDEIMQYSNMFESDYLDILLHQNITEEFIIKYIDKFKDYLRIYSYHFPMSEEFLKYLVDNDLINFDIILYQGVSEELLDYIFSAKPELIKHLNTLLQKRTFTHDFIMRHLNDVDFFTLFKYQRIDENFSREIFTITGDNDKLHAMFTAGATYQLWSDEYVIRYRDYVDWFKYYIYPERVRIPDHKTTYYIEDDDNGYFPDDIEWPILTNPDDPRPIVVNNKKVTPEEWRIKIQAQYLPYELTDDYFIGYMVCDKDGHDLENLGIIYENGNTYELYADITFTPNSFGYTIRTLDECKGYLDDIRKIKRGTKKIILVKAYFTDVAYASKTVEGYDIRVHKIEVVSDYE